MDHVRSASSILERWIIGILDATLLMLLVVWIVNCHLFQIVYIAAACAVGLLAVLSRAAWRHGFRWFFTRPALRFYGWLVVGIISVIVLFYAEENWRGKRAWAALQREAATRGESLELSSVFPPSVPDAENFALAPGVARLLGYADPEPGETPDSRRENLPFFHGERERWPPANWAFQQTTDLAAWQKFFRKPPLTAYQARHSDQPKLQFPVAPEPQTPAADVLLALSRYDSDLAVLRAASQRRKARYPLAYDKGLFGLQSPQTVRMESLPAAAHVLRLRAVAELAQDQSEAALQDTLLALRLADSLRQMPYERLHRARAEMLMFCLQPVWEGLAHHRWNDQQLLALQQHFTDMDLLAEFHLAVRGETFIMMNLADQLQAFLDGRSSPAGDEIRSVKGEDRFGVWLFRLFYPTGWLYQDKVWVFRFYEQRADLAKALATRPRGQFSAECRRATDPFLLIFVVPKLKEVFDDRDQRALFLQTACQQAAVACALERYRLAQGQYPDSLGALVPSYLKQVPADLLAPKGTPLTYRREADGGFALYSVGLNRVDDHGKPSSPVEHWHSPKAYQDPFPRLGEGDWVWRQPGP
jgi:hypothetical protein